MYGYIYKTTNLINGKIYVGQKKSEVFLNEKYLGSGKHLKRAVRRYGESSFKVELLQECNSEAEINSCEKYWIHELDATNPAIGYNISEGGNSPILRGINNGMYGKSQSDFCKKRVSETQSGIKRNSAFRESRRKYMLNKHWYNNGIDEKYFLDSEVPSGYEKGRLQKICHLSERQLIIENIKKILNIKSFVGIEKHIYNNGKFEIVSPICPEGFSLGRLASHNKAISIANSGKTLSAETKLKISKANSGINGGMYGVHRYGELNPMYGKKHSDKTKELIRQQNINTIRISNSNIFPKYKRVKKDLVEAYVKDGWFICKNSKK